MSIHAADVCNAGPWRTGHYRGIATSRYGKGMKHDSHSITMISPGIYKWICHRCGAGNNHRDKSILESQRDRHNCPDQDTIK